MPVNGFQVDFRDNGARLAFPVKPSLPELAEFRVDYDPGAHPREFVNRGGGRQAIRPLAMLGPTLALLDGETLSVVGDITFETSRQEIPTSPSADSDPMPTWNWIRDDRRVTSYQAVISEAQASLKFWRRGETGEHHHDVVDYLVEDPVDTGVSTNRGGFIRTARPIALFLPTLYVLRNHTSVWLSEAGDLTATRSVI